ncbi:MAG: glycoside hydrolase family 57 protein [Marinilabiliaceae bacterium]|nr:glycoside hydrolase family 57 protein [Marinilabiliaceae bacterium]
MRTICFYFQIHQPFRFRRYRFFDIGNDHYYYDDYTNESILRKVSNKSYLPTNKLLLELINKHKGKFKVSFSISGIAIDQFKLYAPEVIDSFKMLAKTGCVEFLSETCSHSLVALKNADEFKKQVTQHSNTIEETFGVKPTVFRNTELIYSDLMGEIVASMGFKAMITEGAKHILGWKSPNYLYCNAINPRLKILLKNYILSDDIAFRFGNKSWCEWPLTADKYVKWLNQIDKKDEVINLFLDYETFGEHQSKETGIFDFISALPEKVFKKSKFTFSTPSEVADSLQPVAAIHVPTPISWADEERDLTAWLGNEMQQEAFNKLYSLLPKIYKCQDNKLLTDWKYLQTSDHFYYMCTKYFSDGDVHAYFNPYETPYEAFINYMNILSDFTIRLNSAVPENSMEVELANLSTLLTEKDDKILRLEKELKKMREKKLSAKTTK